MVSSVQILLIKESKENGSETQTTWKVEVRRRKKVWSKQREEEIIEETLPLRQDWPTFPSSYKYRR